MNSNLTVATPQDKKKRYFKLFTCCVKLHNLRKIKTKIGFKACLHISGRLNWFVLLCDMTFNFVKFAYWLQIYKDKTFKFYVNQISLLPYFCLWSIAISHPILFWLPAPHSVSGTHSYMHTQLILTHSYSTYLHKHSAKTQWKGNDKMKQKGLNTCTCACLPTHTHTQTHITLHGFNCFCVCNYGSAGSRTEHLGALQWNTLWMNSLC